MAPLSGCPGGSADSHVLRDDGQIATFVKDVARGRRAQWTLDPGASAGARRAWTDAASVESIGVELRFGQAFWGCMELAMLRNGSSTHRAVLIAKRRGAATVSANRFSIEYVHLTPAELGYVIDADCSGQPL